MLRYVICDIASVVTGVHIFGGFMERRLTIALLFCLIAANAYANDCNTNSVNDTQDISSQTSRDCNGNEVPDECDVTAPMPVVSLTERDASQSFDVLASHAPSARTVLAQVDGTGPLELVTLNYENSKIDIVPYQSGTQPLPATAIDTGTGPIDLQVVNFDGGLVDLATANAAANSISVHLNDNSGSFLSPAQYPLGAKPDTLVSGDFDNDGDIDLAVSKDNARLSLLLNNGAGTFTVSELSAVPAAGAIAAGDFDGDGDADIVVATTTTATLYLSAGNGTFPSSMNLPDTFGAALARAADLNGDGRLDLIYANEVSSRIVINNGGSYTGSAGPVILDSGAMNFLADIQLADVDGDGDIDLLAFGEGLVYINIGGGPGAFVPAPDRGKIVVALNRGDGVFEGRSERSFANPSRYYGVGVSAGEFNGDSGVDLVVVLEGKLQIGSVTTTTFSSDTNSNAVPDECEPQILRSPAYAFWNTNLDMLNILELVNKGSSDIQVEVRIRQNVNGQLLATRTIPLAASAQFDLILNGAEPLVPANNFGTIEIVFSGSLEARLLSYRLAAQPTAELGSYDFAFALPAVNGQRGKQHVVFNTYNPSTNPNDSAVTQQWLSIVNLDPSRTASFTITSWDKTGAFLLHGEDLDHAPLARNDYDAGGPNRFGGNQVGYHEIVSDDETVPYAAFSVRYGPVAGADRYAFAVPLLGRTQRGEAQYVPISRGAQGSNWLELLNTTDEALSAAIDVVRKDGTVLGQIPVTLGARSQEHYEMGAYLQDGETGTAKIAPSTPLSYLVAQSMFYFRVTNSGSMEASYASQSYSPTTVNLSGSYNLFLGMYDWLKVHNTSNADKSITVSLYQGGQQLSSTTAVIGTLGSVDFGLHESLNYGTQADSYGLIRVAPGSASVFSEVLRLKPTPNGRVDFIVPLSLR